MLAARRPLHRWILFACLVAVSPACGGGTSPSAPSEDTSSAGDTDAAPTDVDAGDAPTPDAGDTDAAAVPDAADAPDLDDVADSGDTAEVEDTLGPLEGEPLAPPEYGDDDPHPAPPAILRDVAMLDDDAEFVHPYVPAHRTTTDGRVGIQVQGGGPHVSFFLFVPERLEAPIMAGPPGPEIMGDPNGVDIRFPPAFEPNVEKIGHHVICDATEEFAREGESPNPYPCGPDDAHDCYSITVISTTSRSTTARLWGTPATVEVAAPKTAEARIVSVEMGAPISGAQIPLTTEWTEPAITVDGRLLTGRLGRLPRQWTNPNTGETLTRNWDLAYSVLPEDADPCDVTGWTAFHPMSHAPHDPDLIGRYGLAAFPFRDSQGNPIADGEELGGSYPWVDREGANVFMSTIPGRIAEQSHEKYPRRCVHEGCEAYDETIDWDRGFAVAGLWTHGKFVLLDGLINNQDWAVGVTPATHYMVSMYRDDAGDDVEVRFGGGRHINALRNTGPYPAGYTNNSNILDSVQNLFHSNPFGRPVTPRDVVWAMSTGVATDEIAFDDYLDANALITANMQASVTPHYNAAGETTSLPVHWNGQVRELLLALPVPAFYALQPEEDADIRLQNGATSPGWNPPAYGHVDAGTGRVEPIALGGIQGRGFWLSGENTVRWTFEEQPQDVSARDWYVSAFVDPRGSADALRELFTFPDGSSVRLAGRDEVVYVRREHAVHRVALPQTGEDGWLHLGLAMREGNTDVTLLLDGFALDRFTSSVPIFTLPPGDLVVGRAGADDWRGFRGWIDEFKVFAYVPNPEVVCNHARGTLVAVDDGSWFDVAAAFPDWAHADVAAAAALPPETRFACYHDHSDDYVAHLGSLPEGAVSVREAINFPEGPLRHGAPRPDSTENAFCLSCHHDGQRGPMTVSALALTPDVPAELDRRRQPSQPPRRVFGNIPAGWIPSGHGPGSPDEAAVAPEGGFLIDAWVLPSAE